VTGSEFATTGSRQTIALLARKKIHHILGSIPERLSCNKLYILTKKKSTQKVTQLVSDGSNLVLF